MNKDGNIKWFLSVSKKFYDTAPLFTVSIVLTSITAQISSLLSFFLPLKIIVILNSGSIPQYLTWALPETDIHILLILLGCATAFCFLLTLLADNLIEKLNNVTVPKLLAKRLSLELHHNRDRIVFSAYSQWSLTLASTFFIFLILFALVLFYLYLAIIVAFYTLVVIVCLILAYKNNKRIKTYLENNFSSTLELLGNLGFFSGFAFIFFDHIMLSPPNLVVAIISMLATRKFFQKTVSVAIGIWKLNQKRTKLSEFVVFSSSPLYICTPDRKNFWTLVAPDVRRLWMNNLMRDLLPDWPSEKTTIWHSSGTTDVAAFCVTDMQDRIFWVKVYDPKRNELANLEITLLTSKTINLPAPEYLAAEEIDGSKVLIYRLPNGRLLRSAELNSARRTLLTKLMAVKPHKSMVDRHLLSHSLAWQRLNTNLLRRCAVAAKDEKQIDQLEVFLTRLPELQERLQTLPLVLINPELNKNTIWMNEDTRQPIALNWQKWSFEPLGASWPISLKDDSTNMQLHDAISQAAKINPELQDVCLCSATLSSLFYELKKACQRQQLRSAIVLVNRILNAV